MLLIAPTSTLVYDPDIVASSVEKGISDYKVDAKRVYCAGYSMGCRGMLRALVSHPHLFAGAAGVAGYAEDRDDHYIELSQAPPIFDQLYKAAAVPICLGYSPSDEVNPAQRTLETSQALGRSKNSCVMT